MHEAGLMQAAIELACHEAKRVRARSIRKLVLRIGKLSGVDPEAMHFAFAALREGTLTEHASLVVEEMPIQCRCRNCMTRFEQVDVDLLCPGCGSVDIRLESGTELYLHQVEVETADE